MANIPGESAGSSHQAPTRRDFLRTGAAGLAGLSLADLAAGQPVANRTPVNCIFLFLTGGPSQLDTWDPKPDAPAEVRGPFRPILTNVPGILLSEHFPRMAQRADRFALLRSVYHEAPPIHETGQQLLQTGRLSAGGIDYPSIGAALTYLTAATPGPVVVNLGTIVRTGVSVSHGQTAGYLGERYPRVLMASVPGETAFAGSCRAAVKLATRGVRMTTVTMFDTVFGKTTWDCHADGGSLASNLDDYQKTLCPRFDQVYTALLDDLEQRGLLQTTLVVAAGEFGRTPYLNPRGGRDHWPGCWTVLMAGGGVRGGQVIGASDRIGSTPADRPIHAAQVAATIYHALGVDPATCLPGPEGQPLPLVDAAPIAELF